MQVASELSLALQSTQYGLKACVENLARRLDIADHLGTGRLSPSTLGRWGNAETVHTSRLASFDVFVRNLTTTLIFTFHVLLVRTLCPRHSGNSMSMWVLLLSSQQVATQVGGHKITLMREGCWLTPVVFLSSPPSRCLRSVGLVFAPERLHEMVAVMDAHGDSLIPTEPVLEFLRKEAGLVSGQPPLPERDVQQVSTLPDNLAFHLPGSPDQWSYLGNLVSYTVCIPAYYLG